jgi:hypothetical protein
VKKIYLLIAIVILIIVVGAKVALPYYAQRHPCEQSFASTPYYTFYGNVTKDIPVTLHYSCDFNNLLIEGGVTQGIYANSDKDAYDHHIAGDPDLGAPDKNMIQVAKDYNFDGYNDLAITNDVGPDYFVQTLVFLYDKQERQFEYNLELSYLENLSIEQDKPQTLSSYMTDSKTKQKTYTYYIWKNGVLTEIQ